MLTHEVARKLEREFGLGDFPLVRKRLFTRIQRVCERGPDEPLLIVAQALEESRSLKDRETGGPATQASKGKWFSKSVVIRLAEAGYWAMGGESSPNETRPNPAAPKAVLNNALAANAAVMAEPGRPPLPPARPHEFPRGFVVCSVCGRRFDAVFLSREVTVAPLHASREEPNGTCSGSGRDVVKGGVS